MTTNKTKENLLVKETIEKVESEIKASINGTQVLKLDKYLLGVENGIMYFVSFETFASIHNLYAAVVEYMYKKETGKLEKLQNVIFEIKRDHDLNESITIESTIDKKEVEIKTDDKKTSTVEKKVKRAFESIAIDYVGGIDNMAQDDDDADENDIQKFLSHSDICMSIREELKKARSNGFLKMPNSREIIEVKHINFIGDDKINSLIINAADKARKRSEFAK